MARKFNGTSDVIRADGATVFNTTTGQVACTVAAWALGVVSAGCIYGEGGSNTEGWAILCGTSPNQAKLRLFVDNNAGSTKLDVTGTATAFEATKWHHICFTQDAASPINYKSYVDGVQDLSGTYAVSSGFTNPPSHTAIGTLVRLGSANRYNGTVAHVATWNRTLSAGEVKSLAGGLPPSFLAPAHYWPLWGVDSPEPDIGTGSHVAGTLTGTTAANEARVMASLLELA